MDHFSFGELRVQRYACRMEMGEAAGTYAARMVADLLKEKPEVNLLFAAAASQREMLRTFVASDIDFSRINALHLDEYIGLAQDAPQRFARFLNDHVFSKRAFRSVHLIGGCADGEESASRYARMLRRYPPDVALIGIGENGHIAFNDPHVAKFDDSLTVRRVFLDETCRAQQVNDGAFSTIDEVPRQAITVTIPVIMGATHLVCTVPGRTKAEALWNTAHGTISEACPATILRTHPSCVLFCDADSGSAFR